MKYLIIITCGLLLTLSGCKQLVEVPAPVTSINSDNIYSDDATAASVLTGIYTTISSKGISVGLSSTSLFLSLSADELGFFNTPNNVNFLPFYQNALTNNNLIGGNYWTNIYPLIFTANAAIEGLTGNQKLTPGVDRQLLGEAKFMRAFCYFYLVNIYGDVPLVTTTDYKANSLPSRTAKDKVYDQIVTDLIDAKGLLGDGYLDASVKNSTMDRLRPTTWAASALLARVYLFRGDWTDAESAASTVINNVALYSLDVPAKAFLSNSNEAIWQLQPVVSGQNTPDALLFIIPPTGPNNTNFVYLSQSLLDSFETGDQRMTTWVNKVTVPVGTVPTTYYYPYKYKVNLLGAPVSEYEMVLRLGEQFLIRSEARAQLGNLSGSADDLNAVRARAGLGGTSAATQPALLTAILHERQVELFTEWGHRWLDLKRTGKIDAVMSVATPAKGGTWDTQKQLFPIPLSELQANPNLVQNSGY